ncbi:hypothetical protein SCLCIDRAFT_27294 [Scleroderma citrinum Foug A]|uniref:Uncharacterized protein n=1 Tax=Scleroderma citrinum Foug A TaxID=1036808 RepID=A0A0C2ZCB2_9AGAM|nr:hypothetical protein SCLCIDRAFT_27294 [Scleroderma citrinum Foug A]
MQLSPATSNASSSLDLMSPKPVIPDVPPRDHSPKMPRSKAWKEVMHHWLEGVPELNLHIPLKDWPYEYMCGLNCGLHSKYNQRHIIVMEFLNQYGGNKTAFMAAYNIKKGIKVLLEAIKAAHQQ